MPNSTNDTPSQPTERRRDLDFPAAYNWGGAKHADLLAERQLLLSAKFSYGLLPFTDEDWLRLQSIRGILDAIDDEREVITDMSDTTPTCWAIIESVRRYGAHYEVQVLLEGQQVSGWIRFGRDREPFTIAPQIGQQVFVVDGGTRALLLAEAEAISGK
jgi:hypothetical protein